ncbi:nucleoid-associated protein [Litorilinea aerophila]|nr:nucleoid-associated protein [Litorilinea aerophila]
MGGGGLGNLMAQMQKLQEEMEKTQAALQEEEFTVSVGGGAVTIVATGEPRLRSVTINPEVVNADDVEMLQDLILTAVNDVLQKAQDLQEERMGGLTGGLGLPPGLGL